MVAYNDIGVKPKQCHEEIGFRKGMDNKEDEGNPFPFDKLARTGNGTIKGAVCETVEESSVS